MGPSQLLVATTNSVISAGTEKAVRDLASASLISKARARPELVRQVIRKAKVDGVAATLKGVRTRLDEEMPLGYSAAGVVVEVGSAVANIRVGDRVATAGAGHSEMQLVSSNLAARVPDEVDLEDAAFSTLASIALHGLRIADLGPGASVCIVGLGLLGQIASRLAIASGYRVAGIDLRQDLVDRAAQEGVLACVEAGEVTTKTIIDWTRGRGVDAVLITAATRASDPLRRAPAICRDAARIVVVGDVGMELERTPLYEKELSVFLARSYGPGRYDRTYEEWGVDYPVGYVRWTAARNLEAVLDLLASGRVRFSDLITHRFPIEQAEGAYALLDSDTPFLGVLLTYGSEPASRATREVAVGQRQSGGDGIGLIGAGGFARTVLVPALKSAGFDNLVSV
ncbi:MAG: zinc-dependent alcohol dehydrogenase, partial [Ilumatobacteraceae bacterium]